MDPIEQANLPYSDPGEATAQRAREIMDLQNVLSTAAGQAVMARIIDRTEFFKMSIFSSNEALLLLTGQKGVGAWIIGEIAKASPEYATKLFQASSPE